MDLLTGRMLDGSEDEDSIENEELGRLKMKAKRRIEREQIRSNFKHIVSLNKVGDSSDEDLQEQDEEFQ
jgi:hypothetical protein